MLKQQTAPEETAAMLIEPVLGEGGYVVPPKSFLKGLREICDKNNILLIFDEVQTGFGRTGKMFCVEHYDVKPDILVSAKGIASGLPLSVIIANEKLMQKWKTGSHGGTFGGNAVSCAAAVATIDAMIEEKMLENAVVRGEQIMKRLHQLQKKYPQISEIRGLGLMIGVEFDQTKVPAGTANNITKACFANNGDNTGMLLLTSGCFEAIRFIPPLIVSKEETDLGLSIFEKALATVFK